MQKPEKTQRSSGPMLGYERIELTVGVRRSEEIPGQWAWRLLLVGKHPCAPVETRCTVICMGLEGSEENAWHAAALAREEIWELLR